MATSPSLFRILKGAEKKDNNTKQSIMLDKDKSGLAIQEGTIYVTTDDGNMYIDVSPTKRIKIGALADRALRADKDENGNQLITTYIASLKYEAQTNTTNAANLPSIKGIAMDGKTVISTIPLPSASTGNNGLVSTTAQTFGGNKTFKDNLAVTGNTALTGTLGVTGKTTLSDALDVTGTTTLKSTLGVTGNTTLGGTLGVTGATTLTGNLTANGSVTMAQSLTISGIINSLVEKSAPFVVKSTTWVENLNADKVDGYDVTNKDFSTAKDTDMSIPSVGAVIKTFLPLLQSIQGLRYRGSVDLTQTTDDGRFGKDVLGTVKVGDVFMISKGGAYAGIYLEPADMLVCVAKSGNAITWNYIQSNINGAVTIKGATESNTGANPLVSVDSIPIFSAATGRQITGSKIFIDGTGHLLPASGNTKQCLGSDTRKWITVWANTFNGTDFNGTNFTGTTFKGTDFTGTTFTGTTFTGNAASASKWKTARTITVTGADTGSVTLDGSKDVTLNLTVAHIHNYAGSSSAGGAANSANKLNTNAGSKTQPVYFANGVPVACTSLNGNATSADKLSTPRTIAVGTAVTSTATSFNGTANITIPINSVKEKFLTWGGQAIVGDIAPIDAAMSYLHSANRAQFAKPAGITVEYSTNAGATWIDYGLSDAQKISLVSGLGAPIYLGKMNSGTSSIDNQLRITIVPSLCNIYTNLKTVLFELSTDGVVNLSTKVESAKRGSETTFSTIGTYKMSGWSGWNSLPLLNGAFGGGENQTSNTGALRFTFSYTSAPASDQYAFVLNLMFLGTTYWITPSNMAKTGHLYSWDYVQNAIFPAAITATAFNGNASSATKLATARTFTIGNTGKTFDGTANVSWSLGEIGAAAASHSHPYLPLSGGTLTGPLTLTDSNGLRMVQGNYGIIFRNDGSNFWLLPTKKDDPYGSWNPSTICTRVSLETGVLFGAAWNDYAEYRKSNCKIPGKCIIEIGDDTLKLSTKRLQPGAEIISDTFGFAIGETKECETPIAVSGRVLAYPYEPLEKFRENIGKPVCSGPNGTVSIMTDEEYQKFGYCAIGTISAVPDYEVWGSGNVKVNGRVWIKV